MNTKFKFSDARVKALPANPSASSSTDLEVSDVSDYGRSVTGLKCLIGKSGNRRFLFRYVFSSRKRSIALGRFPDINVATARKAARHYRPMLAEGIDPKAEQEEKKHTRSWIHEVNRFRRHIEPRFGRLLLRELKASQILQFQLDLNSPQAHRPALAEATCNRVIGILNTMGQLAIRMDELDVNEAMKVKQLREDNVRTRFLDAHELKAVIIAALLYLIDPLDAVPDPIPFIGLLDDLAVITAAIKVLAEQTRPHHQAQASSIIEEL